MAKKKPQTKAEPEPEPEPQPPDEPQPLSPITTILSMKGREEWSEWLTDLAKWCRTDRVGALDRAATELAERVGFRRPPPRL